MFRTARWRLVAWNVGVLGAILVALCTFVYIFFSTRIYNEVDQQLHAQQNRFIRDLDATVYQGSPILALESDRTLNQPPYRTVITNSNGTVIMTSECINMWQGCQYLGYGFRATSTDAINSAIHYGSDHRTAWFRGDPERVLTFTLVSGGVPYVIQISRTAVGEEIALHELALYLFVGALLGILLAGLGSVFLANRALVPIRQAFSRQRQFTADASHELRTPLALIRANAEMLERHSDRLPAGDDELIQEIIRETDHLNRLVSDLLTLARADTESLKITPKPVDFRQLVVGVHEDLQLIAQSNGIESDLALNGPVTVQGDETRLRQLLLILLDNAIKYTDPGGRVEVSLNKVDNHARLVVSDTGIGIPSKDLPHIFDRFYRVDRAREHQSGGTGLGLAIARWIVQAHHGQVKVDSSVGKGTRFQVDLPVG